MVAIFSALGIEAKIRRAVLADCSEKPARVWRKFFARRGSALPLDNTTNISYNTLGCYFAAAEKTMRQTINVKDIKVGSVFKTPVYTDDGILWMPENAAVSQDDINFLGVLAISEVYSESSEATGAPSNIAAPSAIISGTTKQIQSASGFQDVYQELVNTVAQLELLFKQIAGRNTIKTHSLHKNTMSVLQLVKDYQNQVLGLLMTDITGANQREKKAVYNCMLSVLVAEEMGLPEEKVVEIATASLFHDVGMLFLPASLQNKTDKMSPAEYQIMQAHAFYSYHTAHQEFRYPDTVALAILHNHERWNGSGYPHALEGRAIEVGARIIAVADAFLSMIDKKIYKRQLLGYDAIKTMVSENASNFSPDVLKAFVKAIGVYPVGSNVLLSDGSHARVLKNHKVAPLRPIVHVVIPSQSTPIQTLDLLNDKKLYILKAIGVDYGVINSGAQAAISAK